MGLALHLDGLMTEPIEEEFVNDLTAFVGKYAEHLSTVKLNTDFHGAPALGFSPAQPEPMTTQQLAAGRNDPTVNTRLEALEHDISTILSAVERLAGGPAQTPAPTARPEAAVQTRPLGAGRVPPAAASPQPVTPAPAATSATADLPPWAVPLPTPPAPANT